MSYVTGKSFGRENVVNDVINYMQSWTRENYVEDFFS